MARSLEEVRGPFGDHFRQLIRGVHEVTRKLETRLVKEAAIHRQATFADGELKGSASDGAVAPPEQHRDEVAELDNQPTGGDVTVTSQYRPAECRIRIRIPVTTRSGTLYTHLQNTTLIPIVTMIVGSWRNGVTDTDGRCDGRA
jgi:hypothetical protein